VSKNLTHQAAPPPAVAGLTRGQGRRGGNGLPSTDVPRAGPGSPSAPQDQPVLGRSFQIRMSMGIILNEADHLRCLLRAGGGKGARVHLMVFREQLQNHVDFFEIIERALNNDFPPVVTGKLVDVVA